MATSRITTDIRNYVISVGVAGSYQIRDAITPLGYNAHQVFGGIGKLRARGDLKILRTVVLDGKKQHLFIT